MNAACTRCGADLAEGARFCTACGAAVEGCPACGAVVPVGARFCPSCGRAIDEGARVEERKVVTVLLLISSGQPASPTTATQSGSPGSWTATRGRCARPSSRGAEP